VLCCVLCVVCCVLCCVQVAVSSTLMLAFCPLVWMYSIQAEVRERERERERERAPATQRERERDRERCARSYALTELHRPSRPTCPHLQCHHHCAFSAVVLWRLSCGVLWGRAHGGSAATAIEDVVCATVRMAIEDVVCATVRMARAPRRRCAGVAARACLPGLAVAPVAAVGHVQALAGPVISLMEHVVCTSSCWSSHIVAPP
jgi:hypothetical protein